MYTPFEGGVYCNVLLFKRSNRSLIVKIQRFAQVALRFIGLDGAGTREGQHRQRERAGVRAVRY